MTYKKDKKRNANDDKKYFDQFKITPKRYREINQAEFSNRPVILSPNEALLLDEIKNQNNLLDIENRKLLEKICANHNSSFEVYSSILERFQKDIQFQRSLKPHFDAFIKSKK